MAWYDDFYDALTGGGDKHGDGGGGFVGSGFGPSAGPDLLGGQGRAAISRAQASVQSAADRARQEQRDAMDKAIAAQREGRDMAQGALAPYQQRGLGYLDQYAQMAMNPNLDSIRRERQDATDNLNTQMAGMGMHNSGFAGKQHGMLQADYASKLYEARMRAMQPLLGVGPQAAGGLAGAATGTSQGMAGTYNQGGAALAGISQQAGQANMQAGMAQYQNEQAMWNRLMQMGMLYGMSRGGGGMGGNPGAGTAGVGGYPEGFGGGMGMPPGFGG